MSKWMKRSKKISKFSVWIHQKKKILIFFIIFICLYGFLHEIIHQFTGLILGYSGTISWSLIPTFSLKNNPSPLDAFIISISPHIFSIFLLILLFSLNLLTSIKKETLAKIAFFPFLDIIMNFIMMLPAYLLKISNDFWNVIIIGESLGNNILILVFFFMLFIVLTSILLFKPFILHIFNILKINQKHKNKR